MAVISSGDLVLPSNIANGIVEKAKTGSTVAALSGQEPMRFGETTIVTFDEDLTAEFVEENAQKGSDSATPSSVTAVPHKTVVQFRTSDEFKWADEDYQLGVLSKFQDKVSRALARALDLGLYYRINPRTGSAITAWTNYLNSTTNRVEITTSSEPDIDFETAAGLVIGDGYSVNGVALDPTYAWTLSTARYSDGRKKFPELGMGNRIDAFQGISASTSSTAPVRPRTATRPTTTFARSSVTTRVVSGGVFSGPSRSACSSSVTRTTAVRTSRARTRFCSALRLCTRGTWTRPGSRSSRTRSPDASPS